MENKVKNERGAGRKPYPEGKEKRRQARFFLTETEERIVRTFAEIAKKKGVDYALDLLKRVELIKEKGQ